jgi:hypothetical protein
MGKNKRKIRQESINSLWNPTQEGHFMEDLEKIERIGHQGEKSNPSLSSNTQQKTER